MLYETRHQLQDTITRIKQLQPNNCLLWLLRCWVMCLLCWSLSAFFLIIASLLIVVSLFADHHCPSVDYCLLIFNFSYCLWAVSVCLLITVRLFPNHHCLSVDQCPWTLNSYYCSKRLVSASVDHCTSFWWSLSTYLLIITVCLLITVRGN